MSLKLLLYVGVSLTFAATVAAAHPWSGSPAPGKPGVHAHPSAARVKALGGEARLAMAPTSDLSPGAQNPVRRGIPLPKRLR